MNGTLRHLFAGITICGAIGGSFVLGRVVRANTFAPSSVTSVAASSARSRLFAEAGNTAADSRRLADNAQPADPADVFDEALRRIQNDFALDSLDTATLDNAMLARLTAALKDSATRSYTIEQNRVRRSQLLGYYQGIGANFAITHSKQGEISRPVLTVQSVVAGSPADIAGLKTGDRIVEVDGRWIIGVLHADTWRPATDDNGKPDEQSNHPPVPKGISLPAARELLITGTGAARQLTVERPGQNAPLKLNVRTAKTPLSAAAFQWEENGIGHLTIRQFNLAASDFVEKALQQHHDALRGLIVDLRQCPGGVQTETLLPEENGIAALTHLLSHLTDGGTAVLLETKPRKQEPLKVERKEGKPNYPLVVLIDKGTANLAEAAAAALRDLGKAKLIGTPTFGDPILISHTELKSGSALEIASARLLTASGKSLDKGVTPDIVTTPENALEQALKTFAVTRKSTQ